MAVGVDVCGEIMGGGEDFSFWDVLSCRREGPLIGGGIGAVLGVFGFARSLGVVGLDFWGVARASDM